MDHAMVHAFLDSVQYKVENRIDGDNLTRNEGILLDMILDLSGAIAELAKDPGTARVINDHVANYHTREI